MMHQHDRDLVMALAEGTLDPEATAAAEAEIAGCPECAAELVLQTEALAVLHEAPRATLTELESARLRRDLKRELEIVTPVVVAPRRRRFVPALVLGGAAALLLAVLLVGPALQNLGGSSDDIVGLGAFDDAEIVATTAATPAPAITSAPPTTAAPATTSAAAATTAAPAATLEASAAEAEDVPSAQQDDADFTRGIGEDRYVVVVKTLEDLESVRSAFVAQGGNADLTVEFLSPQLATVGGVSEEQFEICGETGIGSVEGALAYVLLGVGEVDEQEAIFVGFLLDPVADSIVLAYQSSTCEELGRAP